MIIFAGCNQKKKEKKDTSQYFPILSYLQSQVKQVDTSLFRITKVETKGSVTDSVIINRSDVRKYASDFLDIPNLREVDQGSDYNETRIYDSVLGLAVLSYLSEDEDQEVTRQEVQIIPGFGGKDRVKTLYIEKEEEKGSDLIEKKMIWEVDKYFHIRTITHLKNGTENIHDLKVLWQDFQSN